MCGILKIDCSPRVPASYPSEYRRKIIKSLSSVVLEPNMKAAAPLIYNTCIISQIEL